jgi:galactokinase
MQPCTQNQAVTSSFFDGNGPVRSFFAPGRINIIGEHLDYNGGLVFPGAISLGITGTIQYRDDMLLRLSSEQGQGACSIDLNSPASLFFDSARGWANYPIGALLYLQNSGIQFERGMNIRFSSTLPAGSGLSSSAALEILTAFMAAGKQVAGDSDRVRMARLMQSMENDYIGVRCGIMDQFTVAMGKKDHAILLNSETLEYSHIPVNTDEYTFVIMNSNKPRKLSDSRYNERRDECERALALLKAVRPSPGHLAQASPGDLAIINDEHLLKRARHVVTEQRRVIESVDALTRGDYRRFGRLLNESHASLRDDYEVTGSELDTLVQAATEAHGCMGARMTGAGFGGCAIAFIRRDSVPAFSRAVGDRYHDMTGLSADFYESGLEDGVREIN